MVSGLWRWAAERESQRGLTSGQVREAKPSIKKQISSYYPPPFAASSPVINGCAAATVTFYTVSSLSHHASGDTLAFGGGVLDCLQRWWPAWLQSCSLSLIISEFISTHLIAALRRDLKHLHTNWLLSFARLRMQLLCIIINDKEMVNKRVRRY